MPLLFFTTSRTFSSLARCCSRSALTVGSPPPGLHAHAAHLSTWSSPSVPATMNAPSSRSFAHVIHLLPLRITFRLCFHVRAAFCVLRPWHSFALASHRARGQPLPRLVRCFNEACANTLEKSGVSFI